MSNWSLLQPWKKSHRPITSTGRNNGWLDRGRKYFVDAPVNPVYHALGRIAGWFIRRQVRKNKREKW